MSDRMASEHKLVGRRDTYDDSRRDTYDDSRLHTYDDSGVNTYDDGRLNTQTYDDGRLNTQTYDDDQVRVDSVNDTIDGGDDRFFLQKLSKNGSLDNFRYILLVSSQQDNYVPYQSARIEKIKQNKKRKKVQIHNQMADNIFRNVKCEAVHRLDVNFVIGEQYLLVLIQEFGQIHRQSSTY